MVIAVHSNYLETADIETSSEDYARRFSGAVGAWFLKVQELATLKMLSPYPSASVLDVGGGHGQTAGALIRNGYRVTVLGSAAVCRERIREYVDRGECAFQVGDILDLPYPDQAFDIVLSYRLLPHVTRWEAYLSELARVAKKAVILDYPEVRSINYVTPLLFDFKKKLEGNTRFYACFRGAELVKFFERQGFNGSDRYAEFFLPMVLHRKLKSPRLSSFLERACRSSGLTGLFGSPVILNFERKEGLQT
jgi:ubiquinone/menaquinone biosynthesis C-methylase UbiE